jgi:hypothetical protein
MLSSCRIPRVAWMAKIMDVNSPSEGRGILTRVEVICKDGNNDLKPYVRVFWLPQSSIRAVMLLRESIHINRLMNISDDDCVKSVTFIVKDVTPTMIFRKIVETLRSMNINVEVKT